MDRASKSTLACGSYLRFLDRFCLFRSAKASLIRIDPQSGLLKFSHAVGRDIFESEVGACQGQQQRRQAQAV
jgi:hypothetical protein